jgi:dCTP deaminase
VILSNSSIIEALNDGRLKIEPRPSDPSPQGSSKYDTTAVNLTLGPSLRVPVEGLAVAVTPGLGDVAATIAQLYDARTIGPDGFDLPIGRLVLGITFEWIELPLSNELPPDVALKGCLSARVEGKSSLARYGLLVHFTAPTIHAGFAGPITLEMMNLGAAPIRLHEGMQICQLIVEQVHGDPIPSPSRFQGQTDPSGR